MKKSNVVAVFSVMAFAVACAPAGSKTTILKSQKPEQGKVSKLEGEAVKAADGEEAAEGQLVLEDELAMGLFNALAMEPKAIKDADGKEGFEKSGNGNTCTMIGTKADDAKYKCVLPLHIKDFTIGKKTKVVNAPKSEAIAETPKTEAPKAEGQKEAPKAEIGLTGQAEGGYLDCRGLDDYEYNECVRMGGIPNQ